MQGGFETHPYKIARRVNVRAGVRAATVCRGDALRRRLPASQALRLIGAGFKPALVPHARGNRIAVISRELKVDRTICGSTEHTVNAERGRV